MGSEAPRNPAGGSGSPSLSPPQTAGVARSLGEATRSRSGKGPGSRHRAHRLAQRPCSLSPERAVSGSREMQAPSPPPAVATTASQPIPGPVPAGGPGTARSSVCRESARAPGLGSTRTPEGTPSAPTGGAACCARHGQGTSRRCYGSKGVPHTQLLKSQPPAPRHVTLLGNRDLGEDGLIHAV